MTETLLSNGYKVIATMRDPEGRNKSKAEELRGKGASIIELDVTNDQSVEKGIAEAIKQSGGIDVVVNNAGIGVSGHQESFTVADFQRLFDVNVFGVQRVNRAVLPHFRDRKAGLLVHVSSLLGRFVLPFFGPYNASKYAVEAIADNYRVELSALGIESVLLEPGGFGTDFASNVMKPSDPRAKDYGPLADGPEQQLQNFEQNMTGDNAPPPQMVADALLGIIKAPRGKRPFRTVVDGLGMGEPIEKYNSVADENNQRHLHRFWHGRDAEGQLGGLWLCIDETAPSNNKIEGSVLIEQTFREKPIPLAPTL